MLYSIVALVQRFLQPLDYFVFFGKMYKGPASPYSRDAYSYFK